MTHQDRPALTGSEAIAAEPKVQAPKTQAPKTPEAIRRAAGLTAEDMAALLGMGDYGYGAWERGTRTPGGSALKLLALIASDPGKMIAALRAA